jgi:hypothetical protein
MVPWTEIETRQMQHEQRVQRVEQTHWMQAEALPAAAIDRWHWRVMSKLGGWLVGLGCRLETHVEHARQVVHTSQMALEANSNSTHPCP